MTGSLLRRVAFVCLIAGSLAIAACDSLSNGGNADGGGRVRLLLTDAPFPFDLVAEARVTISSVELVDARGDVVVITDEDQTFNLLDLRNGVTAELGEDVIEPGVYTHARLRVTDAVVIMKDGRTFDLKVPSGRIKVLLPGFEVDEDGVTEATLDFDVSNSFVVRGNIERPGFRGFIFKPVIRTIRIRLHDDERDFDPDFDEDLEIKGAIEAITATSLTIEGQEIQITSETRFDGIDGLTALLLGDRVEVEYRVTDEGEIIATRISRAEDDEHLFELEGAVTAVSDSSVAVNGIQFVITSETSFDDDLVDAGGLAIGTRVEVKYDVTSNGTLVAVRIEADGN